MTLPIPDAALARHIAVVGETGSGKTHDTKAVIEYVVAQGHRVCVLDTIKSDWWGITSSASGKKPGLPFTILGGPRGHVPLLANSGKAIGQLVGEGKLRLSIIDMADFEPGGPQRFFEHFAQSLWKHIKGVVYLVIEEAHEIAPKERAGFEKENMAIHWAKKLATGSRSKGIRLIIASQRTQAVHNALLGSCKTLMAHSLSLPADQKPIIDWLKANVRDGRLRDNIERDLAFLPTGTAWVCSAKDEFFKKVHFPKIETFDNTATPDLDADEVEVETAPVDHEELKAIIGEAVKEALANDPKALKAEIAKLRIELAKKPGVSISSPSNEAAKTNMAALRAELQKGVDEGYGHGFGRGYAEGLMDGYKNAATEIGVAHQDLARRASDAVARYKEIERAQRSRFGQHKRVPETPVPAQAPYTKPAPVIDAKDGFAPSLTTRPDFQEAQRQETARIRGLLQNGEVQITGAGQRILDGLAELEALGVSQAPRVLVAFLAGYSHLQSKGFVNAIGAIRSAGMVEYTGDGAVFLTDAGRVAAHPPEVALTTQDVQKRIMDLLGGASSKILAPLIEAYPDSLPREEVAQHAGYGHLGSKGFVNALGRMKTLGFVEYPQQGRVRASDLLFP